MDTTRCYCNDPNNEWMYPCHICIDKEDTMTHTFTLIRTNPNNRNYGLEAEVFSYPTKEEMVDSAKNALVALMKKGHRVKSDDQEIFTILETDSDLKWGTIYIGQ